MIDPAKINELTIGSKVSQEKPEVSIIIPNYNTAEFIGETLDSVFAQTFKGNEVIVVNDAAPDTAELKAVLAKYNDDITFIDKAENEGTSASRNLAVEYARGDLLAFLDADDIWAPTFLEKLHDFLITKDLDMAYAAAETFGQRASAAENFLKNNPSEGEITRQMLVEGRCLILPSGSLIRKRAFLAAGGFDPAVKRTEDFDLWMRMIFNGGRIGYLQKILFKFRIRPGSGSGDSIQRIERSRGIWIALRDKLPFTDAEKGTINRHVADADASILRAKGRICVVQKDWQGAKDNFRRAYAMAGQIGLPLKHRLKLASVLLLLNISPGLLLRLFHDFRREEIAYMPVENFDR